MGCLIILPCAADCTVYSKGTIHPDFCWFNACLLFLMSLFPFCHSQTCTDVSGPHAWFLFPATWLRPHQPLLGPLASPTPPRPPIMMFTLSLLLQTYLHIWLWRKTLLIPVSCLTHSCAGGALHGQHHDSHSCFTTVHVPGQLNSTFFFFTNELHLVHMLQMLQTLIPLLALCHSLPASFLYSKALEICFLMFYLKLSNSPLSIFPLPA